MRIACVGKGGSGKTTTSSLLVRYLMHTNQPFLAIDADINQHLGTAFGLTEEQISSIPELGNTLPKLKEILKGQGTLLPDTAHMIKTSLPLEGGHLIRLQKSDSILSHFAYPVTENGYYLRVGGFKEEDLGKRCFHAKTGGAELVLNHLLDTKDETVIVDMTAGADAFASGLFTRFDLTLIVVEPTLKSLEVYKQYKQYADPYDVNIAVIGNKIQDEDDKEFLEEHCGEDLLGFMSASKWIKKTERGSTPPFTDLEEGNIKLLEQIIQNVSETGKNWEKYWDQGIHFHNENALSWANTAVGADVREFVDREFLKKLSTIS